MLHYLATAIIFIVFTGCCAVLADSLFTAWHWYIRTRR